MSPKRCAIVIACAVLVSIAAGCGSLFIDIPEQANPDSGHPSATNGSMLRCRFTIDPPVAFGGVNHSFFCASPCQLPADATFCELKIKPGIGVTARRAGVVLASGITVTEKGTCDCAVGGQLGTLSFENDGTVKIWLDFR